MLTDKLAAVASNRWFGLSIWGQHVHDFAYSLKADPLALVHRKRAEGGVSPGY